MAYNSFFPVGYNPYMQQQITAQNAPQTQIQTNGLISVRNRLEAQNYPVAPGNSVTFKDETAPFVYVKTMGFSQLDRPIFEAFRLVKEESDNVPENSSNSHSSDIDLSVYATKDEIKAISERIDALEAKREKKKEEKTDD